MNEIHSTDDQLRSEAAGSAQKPAGPSRLTLLVLALLLVVLVVAGFFAGYLPRQRRESVLAAESKIAVDSLPVVNVQKVKRADAKTSLVLPGNIQAVTEAPILARASGYIKRRYADIGDRVKEGQVLAEIEAPELNQQILQAKATVDQANSTVEQAQAALQQGHSNENLAQVTAQRWENLSKKGVVSRQENDTYQAQWAAQQANVNALEKAVAAARNNAAAVEANVARLNDLLAYQTVRAPFAGVITLRNVDAGVLVNEGSTLLYRIAQTDRLRTYLNVPQADAGSVRVGQQAVLVVPDLPGHGFPGLVTRTANALDPATRTLLVEVQVSNPGALLMPGMYAQVDLSVPRKDPPLLIPGDTLVVRSDGPQVAVVAPDGRVHFARIQLGRDFGDRLEVLSGLEEGQQVVVNPSDAIREGAKVKPVAAPETAAPASHS
jgi:RND family efflux transporter MFP subunit